MGHLNERQEQLLFDYCMGLASPDECKEAEDLVSSSKKAAEICSQLKSVLSVLNSIEAEPCPDELVERTVSRLNNTARTAQLQLEQLLANEQTQSIPSNRFWHSFGKMLATAAVLIFMASVLIIPPLNFARQKSWQQRCQMQLGQIFGAINNYSLDNDNKLPSMATKAGSPWWKIGDQGLEDNSNTRPMWLLVKDGYVLPSSFVCPGRRQGRAVQLDSNQVKNYNDFPARKYITYSFRIMCPKDVVQTSCGEEVLMSDLNPIFERLPQNHSDSLKLQLNEGMALLNSKNHKGSGQNLLFSNGSVLFKKQRKIGVLQDDIFTLKNTSVYRGHEVPTCSTDAFLAP